MKYSKNADIILLLPLLLFFTTGQREKKNIAKKHYLWVQAIKKGEKHRGLGVIYRNINRILRVNFQQNLYYIKRSH